MANTWTNRVIIVLSWLGTFVAGILSYSHAAHKMVPCGEKIGCAQVAASPASLIFGIPVAYIGLAAYALLALLSMLRPGLGEGAWKKSLLAGFIVAAVGTAFSLWLTFVSLAFIGATCQWCLTSLGLMIAQLVCHAVLAQNGYQDGGAADKTQWSIGAGAAVLALGLFGWNLQLMKAGNWASIKGVNTKVQSDRLMPPDSRIRGNAGAKVMIVEFADFNCPSCRANAPKVKQLYDKYNGKLRWGYHNLALYNLPGHETSLLAARVSYLAAKEGKFWQFADIVFDPSNTERMKTENGIFDIAAEAGLKRDEASKLADPKDQDFLDEMATDESLAVDQMNITSTPTFVIVAEGEPNKAVPPDEIETTLSMEPYRSLLK